MSIHIPSYLILSMMIDIPSHPRKRRQHNNATTNNTNDKQNNNDDNNDNDTKTLIP